MVAESRAFLKVVPGEDVIDLLVTRRPGPARLGQFDEPEEGDRILGDEPRSFRRCREETLVLSQGEAEVLQREDRWHHGVAGLRNVGALRGT